MIGVLTQIIGLAGGCKPDEMAAYESAVEIRRDAKILLTTRPAEPDPLVAHADGS